VQRARAVRADFELTSDNARAIVEICARLDGLPLAIELAASRIKVLPVAAILERLSNRLDLLQSTAADRTDRQRTLRGAIDWSYNLLAEPERALFRRLSIFVGGWRLDEADHIANAAGPLHDDLLDGTAALVDHSLVRRLDESVDVRFGMLETIREFGLEQLDASGERVPTSSTHADCYASLAAQAEPRMTQGPEWPDRLEAEHANIRAALHFLLEHDIQRCLVMCGQLWRFWHLRGHLREGTNITTALLSEPGAAQRTYGRAKALIGLAGLVYWRTMYPEARTAYEEALSIARELGDEMLEVETLYSLAYVRFIDGDRDGSERAFHEALRLYEEHGDELMAAWALASIGMVTTLVGKHEESLPILRESISRYERLGDGYGLRNALAMSSRAMMHLGLVDDAWAATRRVLSDPAVIRETTSVSASLRDAAELLVMSGDPQRAAIVLGAADKLVEESGGEPPQALVNRIDPMPALREQLDHAALQRLLEQGRRMSAEEAISFAME